MPGDLINIQLIPQDYYTEGPVMDAAGNLFFTTLAGGVIYCMDAAAQQHTWGRCSCPNGQVILHNGDHLVCDSKDSALVRFSPQGQFIRKDVERRCAHQRVHVPNDIITDPNGNIYFTDSIRHEGKLFFIGNDGRQRVLGTQLDYPNGLALSNDGKKLFVAESYQNRILVFEILEPGIKGRAEVFINLPSHPSKNVACNLPDGIKVDARGFLWIAHYGMGMVHCVTPEGKLCQSIPLPFDLVSNLFINGNQITVTGGYGEPGPGAVAKITLAHA